MGIKNKVLFLLHKPPPVHGSSMVGQYIMESKIINSTFKAKFIDIGTSKNIDEIGEKNFKKLIRHTITILKTLQTLVFFRPTLGYLAISSKGSAFYKDVMLAYLIKIFGVKLVLHYHNKGVSDKHDKHIDNFLYKLLFKNTKVILLSKQLFYDLKKYLKKEDIYFCPNGIPDINIELQNPKEGSSTAKILFLSNLIESKGVYILLQALSILKNKSVEFQCRFVGSEGDINKEEFNNKLKDLKLKSNVKYLGKKFGKEKHAIFLDTDIFAFPTFYFYECFPLVNIEAMMYGIPVVSTSEGAITDIVENNKTGLIVQKNNPTELASAIEMLIKKPEIRYQMGTAAQMRFKNEFTIDIFENKLCSILQQTASKTN